MAGMAEGTSFMLRVVGMFHIVTSITMLQAKLRTVMRANIVKLQRQKQRHTAITVWVPNAQCIILDGKLLHFCAFHE